MIKSVELTKKAERDLRKVPSFIADKLLAWVSSVAMVGLREVWKIPGYHDEPLHGDRQGQRSIRLSKSYRAIYVIRRNGQIEFISVEEVNKHDY